MLLVRLGPHARPHRATFWPRRSPCCEHAPVGPYHLLTVKWPCVILAQVAIMADILPGTDTPEPQCVVHQARHDDQHRAEFQLHALNL